MQEIPWPAEELLACQGLCSTEFSYLVS